MMTLYLYILYNHDCNVGNKTSCSKIVHDGPCPTQNVMVLVSSECGGPCCVLFRVPTNERNAFECECINK